MDKQYGLPQARTGSRHATVGLIKWPLAINAYIEDLGRDVHNLIWMVWKN
jgi:hypothetical protein